jgi:hypothetical protein
MGHLLPTLELIYAAFRALAACVPLPFILDYGLIDWVAASWSWCTVVVIVLLVCRVSLLFIPHHNA